MKNMTAEEVVDFKAKSVSDVRKSIENSRKEAEANAPSITAAIATISIMGS